MDNNEIDFGSEVDLHHFHAKDTDLVIREFLSQAVKKGLVRVRIVHGKGKSVKKEQVYRILETHADVLSFKNDGHNWGATIVFLKKEG